MIEARLRLLRLLWVAFTVAPVAYLVVAAFLIMQGGGSVAPTGPALRPVLVLLCLGLGVIAVVLGRRQLGAGALAARPFCWSVRARAALTSALRMKGSLGWLEVGCCAGTSQPHSGWRGSVLTESAHH